MSDGGSDYGPADHEFIIRMASLDIADIDTPPSPPRTPSPVPQVLPPMARHTFPSMRSRTSTSDNPTLYQFESPTRRGLTTEWSIAGSATQGVPGAHVRAVQKRPRKKKNAPAAAYTVFRGRKTGVSLTWEEVKPLVIGARGAIYRSYTTVEAAHAAYTYAWARSWVRSTNDPLGAGIPHLPAPVPDASKHNPLHAPEDDGKWYIVYWGINPGVYGSHLECQLNTIGVRGALHESIDGELSIALTKYRAAVRRGNAGMAPPPMYSDVFN
ncbi:hypothetical protein DFH06DRAFT_1127332 [Mycena polygramma]|nr:hypothetical protein DFH06DRAFT_1127332 [Mycena polygramma]